MTEKFAKWQHYTAEQAQEGSFYRNLTPYLRVINPGGLKLIRGTSKVFENCHSVLDTESK